MAIREIVIEGDDALLKNCREVVKFDDRFHGILDDMIDTLRGSGGVGLAAPQVGILRRAVVIEIDKEDGLIELVNPEIVSTSGRQIGLEGCLSLPGQWGIVERPWKVTVKAQDRNGEEFEITGEGLLARCLCHELDHLDGNLYKTRASRMLTPPEIEQFNNGEFQFEEEIYEED